MDAIGEEAYEIFKASDLGDIIGIEGVLFRTNTNELTIKVKTYTHLLTLRPYDKFMVYKIKRKRRRRYVDLIVNEQSRFVTARPKIIRAIQRFFDILLKSPVLQSILGGAARPWYTP